MDIDFTSEEMASPEVFNRKFVEAAAAADNGDFKSASKAATKMIRRRIRENGFSRSILPFETVSNSDLTKLPNTELPVMVEEMEPESPGAKSVSFNDSADTALFQSPIWAN